MRTDALTELIWGLVDAAAEMGVHARSYDPRIASSPIEPDDALGIMTAPPPSSRALRAAPRHGMWLRAWSSLAPHHRTVLAAVHGTGPKGPELPGLGQLTPLLVAVLPERGPKPAKESAVRAVREMHRDALSAWTRAWRAGVRAKSDERTAYYQSLPR